MKVKRIKGWQVTLFLIAGSVSSCFSDPSPEIQRADPVTAGIFIGAIALAVIAGYLLKKKVDPAQRDQRPPSLAQRGDQIDYTLGRRITAMKPVNVFRRGTREETVSGGGKGGPSGGGQKTIIYYEDAVYSVRLGPGSHLFRIIKNQTQVIFEGPITPDTTPSGSLLQDFEGNAFTIWWGEKHQPINYAIAGDDAMGIASRWPYHFYIHFIQYRCGESATWPQLDADAACTCIGTALPGSPCNFGESVPGAGDSGINGAHAIYQLTTGKYPHGVGMDPSKIDFGTLKALGALIQQERTPQNILISGGTTLLDILDDILADLGCLIAQEGDKLVFMPIRPVDNPPILNDAVVAIPTPSFAVAQGSEQITPQYMYPAIQNQYYLTDTSSGDDATARLFGRKKGNQITMATICDSTTAAIVSQRRKLLFLADANQLTLEVMRTARRLVPGQVVILTGFGQVRVTQMQRSSTSGKAKMVASLDQYSLSGGGWNPDTGGGGGGPSAPTPDDAFKVFELPHELVGENLRIGIVRIRKDGQGVPATIWISTNGTSYQALGNQLASAAGFVLPALPKDSPRFVGQGPLASGTTAAAAKVLDLTSDQGSWLGGSQMLVIDDECLFLRSITAESGGYRLNDIIRARLSTARQDHAADSLGGVIAPDAITPIGNLTWGVGMRLWVKAQPRGIDLDDITPVQLVLMGKALGGLPVDNFRPLSRTSASDINFTWTSRIKTGTGGGAGEMPYGEPVVDTTPALEGFFKVDIYNGLGILKRTANSYSESYTYTAADQATDGIGDDPFKLVVTHFINSFGGYPTEYPVPGAD